MKTGLIIMTVLTMAMTSFAKGICFPGDEDVLKKEVGRGRIEYINQNLDYDTLARKAQPAVEKPYGTKAFYEVLKTHINSQKILCVRISGQAYGNSSCDLCAHVSVDFRIRN